jgi:hypothetical protein
MNTCTQIVSTIVQFTRNTRALHKYYDNCIFHTIQGKNIYTGIFKLLDTLIKLPLFSKFAFSVKLKKGETKRKKKVKQLVRLELVKKIFVLHPNDLTNFAIKTFKILTFILFYIRFWKPCFTYSDKVCKFLCTQTLQRHSYIIIATQYVYAQVAVSVFGHPTPICPWTKQNNIIFVSNVIYQLYFCSKHCMKVFFGYVTA